MKLEQIKEAMRAGEVIIVTHKRPDIETDRTRYNLSGSGKSVSVRQFRALHDVLIPMMDGLFADVPQSYRLA